MWLSLYIALAVAAAVLFAPGLMLGRTMGLTSKGALLVGAPLSATLYCMLGLAYHLLGAPATPLTMLLVPTLLLVAGCVVRTWHERKAHGTGGQATGYLAEGVPWRLVLLYAAVGLAAGLVLFAAALPQIDIPMQAWDVVSHLNTTRAMMDAQVMDPRGVSVYAVDEALNVMPGPHGFYPSAWNIVVALVAGVSDIDMALCFLAVNLCFAFVAFPLSTLLALTTLFPQRRGIRAFGALAAIGVTAFPWQLLAYGPLYPNLAGLCMLPAAFALFTRVAHRTATGGRWARCATVLALMVPGMTFLHPNTFFTLGLLLVPWIIHNIRSLGTVRVGRLHLPNPLIVLTFVALAAFVWNGLATSSALRPITEFQWAPFATMPQSLISVLTLSYLNPFHPMAPELAAGALVLIGFVRLLRERADRWLCGSYGLAVVLVLAAQHLDGAAREVLTGFWYNDPARISAMAAIPAVALLAIGLDRTRVWIAGLAERWGGRRGAREPHAATPIACGAALSVAFVALTFWPGVGLPYDRSLNTPVNADHPSDARATIPRDGTIETPMGTYHDVLAHEYRTDGTINPEEIDFLRQVRAIVGTDVVINDPTDGSAQVYGQFGIRCLYRYFDGFYKYEQSHESLVIRYRLDHLADDRSVREAVATTDARYVLILDHDAAQGSYLAGFNDHDMWRGIEDITDDTPGFTVALSEGNMRLYRIDRQG